MIFGAMFERNQNSTKDSSQESFHGSLKGGLLEGGSSAGGVHFFGVLFYPKALKTHILRLLGLNAILYQALGYCEPWG